MNSDFSKLSNEERDVRMTALILGELSTDEAEEFLRAIAADAELAREYEQRKQTIEFVRGTAAMDRKVSPDGTPLKLDDGRRQKLLETFKTPAPREVAPGRRRNLWYVPMSIAAALVGLLVAAVALPTLSKAKARVQRGYRLAAITRLPAAGNQLEVAGESAAEGLKYQWRFQDAAGLPGEAPAPKLPSDSSRRSPRGVSVALPAAVDGRVQISGQVADLGAERMLVEQFNEQPLSADITVARKLPIDRKTAEPNEPAVTRGGTPTANPLVINEMVAHPLPVLTETPPALTADAPKKQTVAGDSGAFTFLLSDAVANASIVSRSESAFLSTAVDHLYSAGQVQSQVENFSIGTAAQNLVSANTWEGLPPTAPVPPQTPSAPGASVFSANAVGHANIKVPPTATPAAASPNSDSYRIGLYVNRTIAPPDAGATPTTGQNGRQNVTLYDNDYDPAAVAAQIQGASDGRAAYAGVSSAERRDGGSQAAGGGVFGGQSRQILVGGSSVDGTRFGSGGHDSFGNRLGGAIQVAVGSASGTDRSQISWTNAATVRGFYDDNPTTASISDPSKAASDMNGRVNVQLPGLVNGMQLDRESSPTRLAGEGRATAGISIQDIQVARTTPIFKIAEAKKPNGPQVVFANPSTTPIADLMPTADLEKRGQSTGQKDSGKLAKLSEELDHLRAVRQKLETNIAATETELRTPAKGTVQIIEEADADSPDKPTLMGRISGALSGEVRRSARISVEQDMTDVDVKNPSFLIRPAADPYFTRTEKEEIQSKPVLSKVIEKLKLNETWAGKRSGESKLSEEETLALLKKKIDVRSDPETSLIDIQVKDGDAEEAARIANTIAEVYRDSRVGQRAQLARGGVKALNEVLAQQDKKITRAQEELERERQKLNLVESDPNFPKPSASSPTPQPEVVTPDNAFSTFSLNVSDVSFKLAAASLERGAMPDVGTIRSEEFINAFDYRDPQPLPGVPIAFAWERARYPFAHNRDVVRFSVKTAAQGREAGKPLNIVLLLDNSGSMERSDRVRIIQESLRSLAAQLKPQDKLSVVTFSRTARLWADGVSGTQAVEVAKQIGALTPEGGTNLEDALDLAYRTALRHYAATAVNRVVLLTDGAANLGNVEPKTLKAKVEGFRQQGVALDCFGIGWEGFNDDLLEQLSRNGDGRYGFVNTPEEAASEFIGQLAGALRVAASDVKVQVEFNPKRVTAYRQIGYAKHQLTKEQFRDNTVDAAEIGAAEAGNALYIVETNLRGEGPIATVRARFRIPQTGDYREHEWVVPFGSAVDLEQSSPAMRLAVSASAFSEWLASSPFSGEVTTDRLLGIFSGVPKVYGADPRPKRLEWMIRQAKSISGK